MRTVILIFFLATACLGQSIDQCKAFYRPEKNFYGKPDTILSLDFSTIKFPKPVSVYHSVYHTPPIPQDTTNTCWSFAATSLLETELKRLGRGEMALSRMHTVYWEYVEKVRRYVQTKGNSLVDPGSQLNAVLLRMQTYGAVPADVYTGLLGNAKIYDERKMLKEIKQHLDFIRDKQWWYEEQAIANVRMIMDRYMGPPPHSFTWQGRTYTPKEFCDQVLALPLNDYVSFISFIKYPFWTQNSYPVPDNWWKCQDYYNVPLADFYQGIKSAIQNGFSVAIAGDVSEPGKYGRANLAIVPTYDVPSAFINQDSREFRFYNRTSTDDHGMHVIGYKAMGNQDWFLVKDSADSAWRGDYPGYYFFNGDYIRLKILAYMVHKDAVKELLEKYKFMSIKNR